MPRRTALALALFAAGCVMSQSDPDREPVTESKRVENLRVYDEIWQRIATSYLNPNRQRPTTAESAQLPLINWQSIQSAFRPRIEQASIQGDARSAMRESLSRLGQSHFTLLPKELKVVDGQAAFQPRASESGLTLRLLNDVAIVTHIDTDSSGDQAGVKPGWIVVSIDGENVAQTIATLRNDLPHDRLAETRILEHLNALLNAGIDRRVSVTFGDGENRRVGKTMVGKAADASMPTFEAKVLNDGNRYFRCRAFIDPSRTLKTLAALIAQPNAGRGLIIDLRGNPGGLNSVATDLLGYLVPSDAKIGVFLRRDAVVPLVVAARPQPFRGPVAVLVDGSSMSSSEIFAQAIQDLRRGQIFGEPTAGVALPSMVATLTNGDRMQYATADYVSMTGARIEAIGVTPDRAVTVTRDALLGGQDPVLDAARAWIARH